MIFKKKCLLLLIIILLCSCAKDVTVEIATNKKVNKGAPFFVLINKNDNIVDFKKITPDKLQNQILEDTTPLYLSYLVIPGVKKDITLKDQRGDFSVFFMLQDAGTKVNNWNFYIKEPSQKFYKFTLDNNKITLNKQKEESYVEDMFF
ncbi:hypothetical protein IB642_01265 [Allofrancisella guangzhouensis]|uniref:Lipoprotein n=1 Tax=Allofrancisella guangzhouensis TaxID=594679 RepID=A0A0A8E753_9GAMM|nr:type VI secretion system lipoprotein IglE [Allofrancisella guangzhouensis]AJC49432.1 hypothetical protein SD28_07280 [Allofrancisella guangzhouensis]MBK2026723.1 hypothetical protein [Allofrancisella guangzhouensis]MBK2043648.1 hypothetical protein [Allofrancisella guangzhouensis]MBK2046197.1 hypothetical protein [Allofrancisella guangzhouensis]